MRFLFKWVFRLLLVIVFLGGVALAAAYGLLSRTVPVSSSTMAISGLGAEVEIVRDRNAVPHIKAKSRKDAIAALGFVHAQDRLWQMEVLRLTGQGRLSEVFGDLAKDTDIFLRSLGLLNAAEKSLLVLNAETRELLQAYSDGVNAYIARQPRLMEPALPVEFILLGHEPEPWRPEHSLLVLKIMSLQLSMNMGREIDRLSYAAQGLNPAEIDDLIPYNAADNPPPLPDISKLFDLEKLAVNSGTKSKDQQTALLDVLENTGIWASNNWVVAGSRTESGKPLLANDPHLKYGAPSLWYLAHMSWPDGETGTTNVIGASLPATPLIVLGRTDYVAWGFTNSGADVQDLYVEKLHVEDDNRYLTPDGWKEFEKIPELIKIKGAADYQFDRLVSRHGPILPKKFRNLGKLLPRRQVVALQWTGLSEDDRGIEALMGVYQAKTVLEFREAMRPTQSPMQSIVIADIEGNIGLIAPARVPKRKPENKIAGRAPVPGWKAEYDWDGYLAFEQLPFIYNPPGGAIGTANSRFIPTFYAHHLTYDWDETFRQSRVKELVVNANKKHSIGTMKAAQLDIRSGALLELRDEMIATLGDRAGEYGSVLDMLKAWDGEMRADAAEPLIMMAWFRSALQQMFEDDLGAAFKRFNNARATTLLKALREGGARDWCNNTSTKAPETCADSIGTALTVALGELRLERGEDMGKWRWGDVHITHNEHTPFSKVKALSWLFSIDVESDGGAYTLLRNKPNFKSDKPYQATHGAGYRAIYDFSDLNKSMFIQTTGQSGNVMSGNYRDLSQLWASGRYISMSTKPSDYEKGALGTWRLTPKEK